MKMENQECIYGNFSTFMKLSSIFFFFWYVCSAIVGNGARL